MDVEISKYTVAWFKLAEFVSRKEKEKALGIFKLLSHSLQDKGLAYQLEGDIFLSFSDLESAKRSYLEAIQLYIKANNLLPAAAIYEHLLCLHPVNSFEYALKILELYFCIGNKVKINKAIKLLVNSFTVENNINKVEAYLNCLDFKLKDRIEIYEMLILLSLKVGKIPKSNLYRYLEMVINGLNVIDSKKLDAFFVKLEVVDSEAYKYALDFLCTK